MLKYREAVYNNYFSNQVNKQNTDYQKLINIQYKQLIKEIVPLLPTDKSSRIVDLGCGYGSFVYTAKKAGYTNIAGYDLSQEQVDTAHKLGVNEVQLGSLDDFLDSSETADVIVCIDLIEHLTKDEFVAFSQKVKKSLNPGGKVIFRTPNMDAIQPGIFAYGDISHELFLNKSSALQIMNSMGFENVSVKGGLINNQKPLLNQVRAVLWFFIKLRLKIELWASGRQWTNVVFEPNLLIVGEV